MDQKRESRNKRMYKQLILRMWWEYKVRKGRLFDIGTIHTASEYDLWNYSASYQLENHPVSSCLNQPIWKMEMVRKPPS